MPQNNNNSVSHGNLLSEQTRLLFSAFPVMNILEPACALVVIWLYWQPHSQLSLIGWGAMVGGMVLGVIEKLVGGYVSTAFEHAMAFAILMVILATRPQGLFGRAEVTKV